MATSASHLKRITLNLARNPDFPEGSTTRGYVIEAPLDREGHIDQEAWKDARQLCRVRRFWEGEDEREGLLVHKAGGPQGQTWVMHYDRSGEKDEIGFRFGAHRFDPGQYVSIAEADGQILTFKVVSVEPAP